MGFCYAAAEKMPYVNLQHERSRSLVIQIDRDIFLVMVQAAAPGRARMLMKERISGCT